MQKDKTRFEKLREAMVRNQLIARGISDPEVLAAMRTVERHRFVSAVLQTQAYSDHPLPIAKEQTISQPYIVAYMSEQLELKKNDRVLEIGTGSGYQAAVLAEIVDSVFTIEINPSLSKTAQKLFSQLGYSQIRCKIGDGYAGWPEKAPFNAIIVTAAPDHIPQPLIEQLAEGGRMIIPVGRMEQTLILLKKDQKGIRKEVKLPVRFVPFLQDSIPGK